MIGVFGGPPHQCFHACRLYGVKKLRVMLMGQIVNCHYSSCFSKRRLYILAMKDVRFGLPKMPGKGSTQARNGIVRDWRESESGIILNFIASGWMGIAEVVLIAAFVRCQSVQKLPEIRFVAPGLRSQTMDVNGDFHQFDDS